jgi:hypothetical protein
MTDQRTDRPTPRSGEPHSDARQSQGWTAGPEDRDPADRMQTEPEAGPVEDDDEQRPPHEL